MAKRRSKQQLVKKPGTFSAWLKSVLIAVAGLAVLSALVVTLFPWMQVRRELETAFFEQTGRRLTLRGGLGVGVMPVFGLQARDVVIDNAPGGSADALLNIDTVTFGVDPLPLLTGRLRIAHLVIQEASLNLERDRAGQPNWRMALHPRAAREGRWLKDVSFGDVRVLGGRILYQEAGQKPQLFSDIDLQLSAPSLDQPAVVNGALYVRGDKLLTRLTAMTPRALLSGQGSAVRAVIESSQVNAGFNGVYDPKLGLTGWATLGGPSLRDLAALVGAPLGDGKGLGPFAAEGRLHLAGGQAEFTRADYRLDQIRANGDLAFDVSRGRVAVAGRVSTTGIDMNLYLTDKPVNAGAPWSDDSLDAARLNAFDADVKLATTGIVVHRVHLGKTIVFAKLKDGTLTADLREAALYGGTAVGRVTVRSVGKAAVLDEDLHIAGADAKGFLSDAYGFDRLEGVANLNLTLHAAGDSQSMLMRSLSGTAALTLNGGAIRGLDAGLILRQPKSAFDGGALNAQAMTPLSAASASFVLQNGVATTKDLNLQGRDVTTTGTGRIDIGNQTQDLALVSRSPATTPISYRVSGPWAHPQLGFDFGGELKIGLDQVISQGKQEINQLGDAFNKLTGNKK